MEQPIFTTTQFMIMVSGQRHWNRLLRRWKTERKSSLQTAWHHKRPAAPV